MGRIGWRSCTMIRMYRLFPALPVLAAVIVVALTTACSGKPPEDKDYATRLGGDRQAKDAQFLKEDEPVPKSRKARLLPLAYFPIDPKYSVPAALKPAGSETI